MPGCPILQHGTGAGLDMPLPILFGCHWIYALIEWERIMSPPLSKTGEPMRGERELVHTCMILTR